MAGETPACPTAETAVLLYPLMGNTFGQLFRVTTFGESHGGGIGDRWGGAFASRNDRPVRECVTGRSRVNRPEHTRANATRSRCFGSMLPCILKTKPENDSRSGATIPPAEGRGPGAGAWARRASSKS